MSNSKVTRATAFEAAQLIKPPALPGVSDLLLRNDVNKATGEVALLQKEAANARAAQQRVETELAKQQERAANAEKSLAELQERIRPRGLTGVQQALLIEFLQNNIKGSIDITCPLGNAEALAFASQIDTVLRSAGWMTSGVSQAVYTPDNPIGIDLAVRNARSAPPFAIVLQQAFKLIGLPVDGTERSDIPEGKVLLTVGVKP